MEYILIAVIAYLIGSLNFAIVLSKTVLKKDIREFGSKNAGTTNAFRMMGAKLGTTVLLGDVLKAFLAVSIGYKLGYDEGKLIAGVFVIIGHIYPIYFKFRGGKGVATSAGMLLAFDLHMFAMFISVFLVVLFISKFVSLASMCAGISLPVGMYMYYQEAFFVLVGILISLGLVYMHRANIVRILNHEENKVSFKKKRG